ncbi:MAG: transketolase N-terminal domain protein [Parcubacteria group bacterium Athens0714_24]|nr:MAG: transketolase N-terminal domain protein [Parcubacteria group bacterium Athens0714_24]
MHLSDEQIKKLEETANNLRQEVISMLLGAKSGHSAGPLGMADVFTVLYFTDAVKKDPKNPDWTERDRIVLSNGHICPIQYAAMARAGYFPIEQLKTLRKFGSGLQGHPHREKLPGIETTSGPLGSGLSQSCGMAYAFKMNKTKQQTYCLMGDGELDCGQVWEAAMWAGKNHLDNLTAIIDRNNIQIDGFTEDVMPLEPLKEKFESFGWHVLEIDGNNINEIYEALLEAKAIFEKPVCIIAHTIPGKGVDFMEFDFTWHGKPPQPEEGKKALEELRTLQGKIESEI